MRLDQTTTLNTLQESIAPNSEAQVFSSDLVGGSNIVEPNIITPINPSVKTLIKGGGITTLEEVETALEAPVKEPSATTDDNKIYGGGGTTPDSPIIINKPKPNYIVYGIVGVIGTLVVYKLFFKKK